MPAATSDVDLAREGVRAAGQSSDCAVQVGACRTSRDVSDDDAHVVRLMRSRHRKILRGLPALAGSGMRRPPL